MVLGVQTTFAQAEIVNDSIVKDSVRNIRFNYKQLVIPGILTSYGVVGIESDQLKNWNTNIRPEVMDDIDGKITIDDFTQWAPAGAVYGLNAVGIESKNNFRGRTVILATWYLIMSTTVFGLKLLTKIERPDGSSNNSFPSGHTATAFSGAEFYTRSKKTSQFGMALQAMP